MMVSIKEPKTEVNIIRSNPIEKLTYATNGVLPLKLSVNV